MPQESDKKLLILYIYDVLKNESDEDNPLKQKDIIDKVKSASGITCNRKTIKANIDALNTYFDNIKSDLQIIRTPKGKTKDKSGFYLIFKWQSIRTFDVAIFSGCYLFKQRSFRTGC